MQLVRVDIDKYSLLTCMVVFLLLSCRFKGVEENIVLIGVDSLDREGIAKVISKINIGDPTVVAVDLNFVGRTDYYKDRALVFALSECKELVMATIIQDFNESSHEYARFIDESEPEFLINAETGFINAVLDTDSTLQRFFTFANVAGTTHYHFAVKTAMIFDSVKTADYLSNHSRIESLKDVDRNFTTLNSDFILSDRFQAHELKNKIVMVGYLGPLQEDIFFSPLARKKHIDKPDMYGLEYLAYIVAQILE